VFADQSRYAVEIGPPEGRLRYHKYCGDLLTTTIRALAFVFLLLLPAAAPAQDDPGETQPLAKNTVDWSLGFGVFSSPRPYVGAEDFVMAIPLVEVNYKKLYVQGIQAGYHFIQNENFNFDVRAGIVFFGLEPDDSPFLEGMDPRASSIEGGLVFDWKPGKYMLRTTVATDLLGRSNGQQAAVDFSRMWQFHGRALGLMPSIGVVWQSSSFVDYYYGVTPGEARPWRPPFRGDSAINFRASLLAYMFVSHRIRFVGLVEIQSFENEIFESPIVDQRRGIFGLFGVTYRFGKL